MKHYRVIILPSAEQNITAAYLWIAGHDEPAARRWYNRLLEAILSLGTFPERCPLARESRFLSAEIRQLLHGQRQHKYRILFTVRGQAVHVLHVRHGARLALGESFPPE